jgi:hypothetical protein
MAPDVRWPEFGSWRSGLIFGIPLFDIIYKGVDIDRTSDAAEFARTTPGSRT